MANIKSQKKRIKTAEKARIRNRAVRSELKTAVKTVAVAVEAGDASAAQTAAQKTCERCRNHVNKRIDKGNISKNPNRKR